MKNFALILHRRMFVSAAIMVSMALFVMLAVQPGQPVQASGVGQQDRVTPTDIPTSVPAASSGQSQLGEIRLTAAGAPALAWTTIEWQDGRGQWHAVTGWQGELDNTGQLTWWVADTELGSRGLYRWVVYESRGGSVWATSGVFRLPAAAGEMVRVVLSAPAAAWASTGTGAPITYTVQPGDNLFRIALRFQTTVGALLAANRLDDARIFPGQVLVLRGSVSSSGPGPTLSPTLPMRTDPIPRGHYTVQAGDTIYRLALRAGVSVAALQSANHLYGTVIQVGQTLTIP
jgi:LysM repeat protein